MQVSLTDDHPIFRRGLRQLIEEADGHQICGEHGDGEAALAHFEQHRCDVAIVDLDMPGRGGLELLRAVSARHPEQRVLIVSFHPEAQYATRALSLGARGYLTKSAAEEHLIAAITAIARGGHFLTPAAATLVVSGGLRDMRPHERLSEREFQVLVLLAQGVPPGEIGARLALSPKTVSTYKTRLHEKLGIESAAGLVRYALDQGLLP
ncbi:MAG: response regulator transcription factor [Deltaproteobacteria bacterium]|nr:response regulator transcription factor [Deltaproteobacteria bacterium]